MSTTGQERHDWQSDFMLEIRTAEGEGPIQPKSAVRFIRN